MMLFKDVTFRFFALARLILVLLGVFMFTFVYAMDMSELYSRRDGFQRHIQKQLDTRIKAILPDDLVMVRTEMHLNYFYDKPKDIINPDVMLGKLGEAEPIGGKIVPRRRIAKAAFMDNVAKIDIDVLLDHTIEGHFEAEIRNIVHAILNEVPKSKIEINLSRIMFKKQYIGEEVANLNVKAKENGPLLIGVAFFVILAIFVLGIFAWLKGGMRSIHHLADRALDVMEQKARHPVVPEKIIISTGNGVQENSASATSNINSLYKISQAKDEVTQARLELSHLIAVAAGRPMRLVHLIRDWVYRNNEESNAALMLMPEILGTDLFASTVAGLTEEERVLWSTLIARQMSARDVLLGKSFIKSHTHELLVDSSGHVESETQQLGITTDEYIEIIYKDINLGAHLMKGMPDGQVKIIMKKLPKGYVSQVIEASMKSDNYRHEEVVAKVKGLLSQLREDRFKALPPTYVDYIVQQLKDVGPVREKEILNMFRSSGRMEVLQNVVKEVFPSELICEMSTSFLRTILADFDLLERAELMVLAKQEEIKSIQLCLGEKDSPERLAIDVEIERIDNDIRALKKLKDNAEKCWSEFYKRARNIIKHNPEFERQANFLLDRWLFQAVSQDQQKIKKYSNAA